MPLTLLTIIKRSTYNRSEKLKSRKLIRKVFNEGQSFYQYPLKVLYIKGEANTHVLQAGVAVSSRNFKKAVDRNRVKRVLREAWRLQKNTLDESLSTTATSVNVFLIYTGTELPEFSVLFLKVGEIINKLINIIHESDPLHSQ